MRLSLPRTGNRPLEVLCLGAHADDIEIGCGGTLLALQAARPVRVRWIVWSAVGERAREAAESAASFLAGSSDSDVRTHAFRDGYLPDARGSVKDAFAAIADGYESGPGPDVVFTHDESDLHQDHALLGALTRETFRDHLILGYEIPKVDGGLRTPNLYVPLDEPTARRKADLLLAGFPSQHAKPWFRAETFLALMRIRGVESGSDSGFAEGFHARRVVLSG